MWIKILIIADSRGRRLGHELDRAFEYVDYRLIWRSGLSLRGVPDFAADSILEFKPHMIYVLPGICDVTYLISRNPPSVALRHSTVQGTVNYYMHSIDRAHQGLYALSNSVGHPIMIIFPTLTGLDIRRYNGFPRNLISPQQSTLNQAVININRLVTAMNRSMGIFTPFLSTPVHPRCRRRYRFVYDRLVDGCHPSGHLCSIWANRLFTNALRNVDKYTTFSLINSMY